MMFHLWQRMAALFVVVIGWQSFPVMAQTAKAPVAKMQDIARADRRPTKQAMKSETMSSEKKKTKNFSYSYLLPFGVGQFEQEKTILGTTFATVQAGFLLLYFDRINAVRSSNADAADVMRGADMNAARNDPTILSFLDQNEAFTLKAQQQANIALLGFFAMYTVGVVDAVFDPLGKLGYFGKKKKYEVIGQAETSALEGGSHRGADRTVERETRIGMFYQPAPGSASALGLTLQKPL